MHEKMLLCMLGVLQHGLSLCSSVQSKVCYFSSFRSFVARHSYLFFKAWAYGKGWPTGHGLPKVLSRPALPDPSTPCGQATPEAALQLSQRGGAAYGSLLPFWTPHAVRLCFKDVGPEALIGVVNVLVLLFASRFPSVRSGASSSLYTLLKASATVRQTMLRNNITN
jgi:hypothetical protein